MAALIAPSVCRFVVHGTYSGQAVVNIVDMALETTGSTEGRGDAIFGQAGVIINEWSDSILPELSNKYTANSVSWVDLDDEDGSTGERSDTSQKTWPEAGKLTANSMPGNVSIRVEKRTNAKRGQRQGRMYLCGVSELATPPETPNEVFPATLEALNNRLESFLGDVNQDTSDLLGVGYTSRMVVVHTKDGVFKDFSEVTGLAGAPRIASQRRRLTL